jgi:hypothetical protein
MREIERIQEQPIPTYRSAHSPTAHCRPEFNFRFRPWQSRFAFLRVNFSTIYAFVTFP